jgi:hypothetical protein
MFLMGFLLMVKKNGYFRYGVFNIKPAEDKSVVNSLDTWHKFCSLLTNGKGV